MRMMYAFDRRDFFGTYREWSTYDKYIWGCSVLEQKEDLILNVMTARRHFLSEARRDRKSVV